MACGYNPRKPRSTTTSLILLAYKPPTQTPQHHSTGTSIPPNDDHSTANETTDAAASTIFRPVKTPHNGRLTYDCAYFNRGTACCCSSLLSRYTMLAVVPDGSVGAVHHARWPDLYGDVWHLSAPLAYSARRSTPR